jgi:hypothetical protein
MTARVGNCKEASLAAAVMKGVAAGMSELVGIAMVGAMDDKLDDQVDQVDVGDQDEVVTTK